MTDIYLPPAFYYPKALTNGARVLPPPPLRPADTRPRFSSGSERPSTATSDRFPPSDRHDPLTNEAGPPSSRPNTSSMRQNTLPFLYGYHTLPATLPLTQQPSLYGATSALQSPVTPEPNAFDRDMKLLKKKGQTIDMIDKAGRKLGFPSLTIFAAKVYYHRFATLTGLQNTRTFDVATACLFTASKSEETVKKLHYILNAMHAILDPTKPEIDPESQAMEEERRRILSLEMRILEAIRFDFRIANAYTFARKMAHQLKMDRQAASRAQELITDSLRSTLCVQYPPHVIAAGTLMLASVMCGQPFEPTVQKPSGDVMPWDQYYKFREEDAEDVAHQILDLYIQVDERSKESALVDWKIHFQQITFHKNKERHAAREVIHRRALALEMERQRLQAEAEARERHEAEERMRHEAEERMRRHRQLELLKQQQQQKQQELLAKQQHGRRQHHYASGSALPHEDGSRKRKPGDQDVHMMDEEEERRARAEEEQWRAEEKARLLRHANPPKHDRHRSTPNERSSHHSDRSTHHQERHHQHHHTDRSSKSTPHRPPRSRQGQSTPSTSANQVPLGTIYPDESKRPSRGDERYDYRADDVRPYDPYSRHRSPPNSQKRRDRYTPAPTEENSYSHRDRARPATGERRKTDHYSRGQQQSSSPYDYGRRRDRPRSPSPPPSHARADRSRQRGQRRPEATEEEEEDFVSRRQKSRY